MQGWQDLFAPPYDNCPEIMMAVSCVDSSNCYIPGGSNGVGFGLFDFNGEVNGNFNQLNMPDAPLMMMAIAVGGSADAPHGAVGGVGIGSGLQFFVNSTTVMDSIAPLFVVTQDIASSASGNHIIAVDQAGSNSVLYSGDAGFIFEQKPITSPIPLNVTFARYSSVIDEDTWYVTLGSWPNKDPHADHLDLSARVSVTRDANGKVKRASKKMLGRVQAGSGSASSSSGSAHSSSSGSGGGGGAYSAAIAKTSDGGNTWTTQFSSATNFYFNGIDCSDATHCIAVGEGFDEDAAAHIYATNDGRKWREVLKVPSTSSASYSLMAVSISPANPLHAWVAGSVESSISSSSLFYHTTDGGKTWTQGANLPTLARSPT